MNKFEIITIEDKQITFDVSKLISNETVMFNATEAAKQFGKDAHDWLKTKDTKEYISAVTSFMMQDFSNGGLSVQQDLSLVRTQKGGKYSGTWIHNELAIAFLRWLNPYFAVACDRAIRNLINGEKTRKSNRNDTKLGYKPLTDAIKLAHEEPKYYHYINEANLINRIVFGLDAKEFRNQNETKSVRDNATAEQLSDIAMLQDLDTHLIHMGHSYEQRKDILMDYYIKRKKQDGRMKQIKQPLKLLTPQKQATSA